MMTPVVEIAIIIPASGPNSGIAGFGLGWFVVLVDGGDCTLVGVNANVVLEVLSCPPYVTSISYVPAVFQRSPPATAWVE